MAFIHCSCAYSSRIVEHDVDCGGAFARCGLELDEPRRLRFARLPHTGTKPHTARRESERHQQHIVALTQQQWPKQITFCRSRLLLVLLVARDFTRHLTMNTVVQYIRTVDFTVNKSTFPDVTQCNALYAPLDAISNKTLLRFTFIPCFSTSRLFKTTLASALVIQVFSQYKHFPVYSLESITCKFFKVWFAGFHIYFIHFTYHLICWISTKLIVWVFTKPLIQSICFLICWYI